MKPKNIVWLALGILVAIVAAWGLFRPAGGGITNVDAAGAQKAITQGAQVIDVRTAGEYQLGHLSGALNVPLDQLETQAASWNRDATYLVYCATGARSASAVEIMKSLGFKNIRHFSAGLQAWNGQLEQGGSTTAQTIQTNGKPVMVEFYTDS